MKKYIAVFDETGTSNRPQSTEESGFGVGAVLFPLEQAPELARISKHLGSIVGKEDYKYKDVLQNEAARELFIQYESLHTSVRVLCSWRLHDS